MLIVVEIPHQMPVEVYTVENENKFLGLASKVKDFSYNRLDLKKAIDIFGEDDIPGELKSILNKNGSAIEVTSHGDSVEYYSEAEAPNELDLAKDAMFSDLHAGFLLTESEAHKFVDGDIWSGHGSLDAQMKVEKALKDWF